MKKERIKEVFDFLFPVCTCLVCRGELNAPQNVYLCDACAGKLPLNTDEVILRDTEQKQWFKKAVSAFRYEGDVVGLVLRFKYNNEEAVADALAPFMAAAFLHGKNKGDLFVPVPLSKKRQKQRGYNQAELLANKVGQMLGIDVAGGVLERIKATEVQKKMSVRERTENLKDAFRVCAPEKIKDKVIWLVDDVFTSGATVNECAKVLTEAGAGTVNVLTACCAVFGG